MPVPAPRRDVDRVPRLPLVALAVDLAPPRAFDDEELRVPGVAVDRGERAGIDLVHQRIEAAGRRISVPAHVHAAAQATSGLLQLHILAPDHAAPVLAPLLEELGAPLLLDRVVRDLGGGFRAQGISVIWNGVLSEGTSP